MIFSFLARRVPPSRDLVRSRQVKLRISRFVREPGEVGSGQRWTPTLALVLSCNRRIFSAACLIGVGPAQSVREGVEFLERTGVNEQERPMLELELVQFRQPLPKILSFSTA